MRCLTSCFRFSCNTQRTNECDGLKPSSACARSAKGGGPYSEESATQADWAALVSLLTGEVPHNDWWDILQSTSAALTRRMRADHASIFMVTDEGVAALSISGPPLFGGLRSGQLLLPAGGRASGGGGPAGYSTDASSLEDGCSSSFGAPLLCPGGLGPEDVCALAAALQEQQTTTSVPIVYRSEVVDPDSGSSGGCSTRQHQQQQSLQPQIHRLVGCHRGHGSVPGARSPPLHVITTNISKSNKGGCGGAPSSSLRRHYVAVGIPGGKSVAGLFILSATGPVPPAAWQAERLVLLAALMAPLLRSPQVLLSRRVLAKLHAVTTIQQLVGVLGYAAAELLGTAVRVAMQPRVALLRNDGAAAAVFGVPGSELLEGGGGVGAHSACQRRSRELVLVDAGGSGFNPTIKNTTNNINNNINYKPVDPVILGQNSVPEQRSMGNAGGAAAASGFGGTGAGTGRSQFGKVLGFMGGPSGASVLGGGGGSGCHGRSLPLQGTLLAEALTRGSGLCIADCNAYVQDSRAFPRDLMLLSRDGAAPPQSLALATSCHGGVPLLALYGTYPSVLPQPLLQSVVQELGQLLRAFTPTVATLLLPGGPMAHEWRLLHDELLGPAGLGLSCGAASATTITRLRTSSPTPPTPPAAAAHAQSAATAPRLEPPPMPTEPAGGSAGAGEAEIPAMKVATAAALVSGSDAAAAAGADGPPNSAASASKHLDAFMTSSPAGGGIGAATVVTPIACSLGSSRTATAQPYTGRTSFSLEAAGSPRGGMRLAPLITTLHDRLKSAQAEQLTSCSRAACRRQDLASLRPLERVGRGGYGSVYRGLYHGSEVAIKVVEDPSPSFATAAAVAAAAMSPNAAAAEAAAGVTLRAKHLHDAIELVASASMSHPNIVQLITYFVDVRAQHIHRQHQRRDRNSRGERAAAAAAGAAAATAAAADGADAGGDRGDTNVGGGGGDSGELLQLVHLSSSGLESPNSSSTEAGGDNEAIVLVMEYCDLGCLKDAIQDGSFLHSEAVAQVQALDRTLQQQQAQHQNQQQAQQAQALARQASQAALAQRDVALVNMKAVYSTLLEIALALRHMHGLHLVHCDLKPQNVLLKSSPRDPRGFTVKLSDFGLAKMMAADDAGQLVIDDGIQSGTITHLPPEALQGCRQLGPAVDVYSFGIVMFQLLCGVTVYRGLDVRQIIRGVVRQGLRPVFPARAPVEYRDLAQRCWHEQPSCRPTALQLVSELEALLEACDEPQWPPPRRGGGGAGGSLGSVGAGGATSCASRRRLPSRCATETAIQGMRPPAATTVPPPPPPAASTGVVLRRPPFFL